MTLFLFNNSILLATTYDTDNRFTKNCIIVRLRHFNYVPVVRDVSYTANPLLQYGVSEESLRFAVRTLVSVVHHLRSGYTDDKNFKAYVRNGLENFPKMVFRRKH